MIQRRLPYPHQPLTMDVFLPSEDGPEALMMPFSIPSIKDDSDDDLSWAGDYHCSLPENDRDDTEGSEDISMLMYDNPKEHTLSKSNVSSKTALAVESVLFDDEIQVREYAVTVGISPSTHDSCPITLDWSYIEYTDTIFEWNLSSRTRERPHVLSLEERRQRISRVQGCSLERVRALEIERVLEHLQDECVPRQSSGTRQRQVEQSSPCCLFLPSGKTPFVLPEAREESLIASLQLGPSPHEA